MTDHSNSNSKGNGSGWLLSELEKTAGVEFAVLVSADGMLQAHTGELDIDYAEKLAAVAATLRGASRAYAQEAGGEGVRQVLIETVTHIALITQAGENAMLVVKTDGPDADMGWSARRHIAWPHAWAASWPSPHEAPAARKHRRHDRAAAGPGSDQALRPHGRTYPPEPGRPPGKPGVRRDRHRSGPRAGARRVLALFTPSQGGGLAVADIAAALALPPSATRILVADLMNQGLLTAPTAAEPEQPAASLMERVLDGLRALA
ncbi:roadblock/LC7 domain-containing protein [Streptomyces viridosporus]